MRYLLALTFVLPLIIARPGRAQTAETVIPSLADPDREVRRNAEQKLVSMGVGARTALIDACRVDDPAIASVATRILLSLPWDRPGDPPAVVTQLRNYGSLDEAGRIGNIAMIANQNGDAAWPVLLRLILEDPSEDVCWSIVVQLVGRDQAKDALLQRIRQLNPPDNRPAALVLVARAWDKVDAAKSLSFYRRAIAAETHRSSYDEGQLDPAFDALVVDAITNHHFDEAATIRRSQAARMGVTRSSYPGPVYALFVLHAFYGPLKGFTEDLQNYSEFIGDPEVMYPLARIYLRQGRTIEALALRDAARSATLSPEKRAFLVDWLYDRCWNDFARLEANAILVSDDPAAIEAQLSAHYYLHDIADVEENDAAVIDHLNQITALAEKARIPTQGNVMLMTLAIPEQIAWRTARIASKKGDNAAMGKALDELVKLNPTSSDVVLNAFPLLIKAGRQAEAMELFDRVYAKLTKNLPDAIENDRARALNNFAWFLACCNQKLEEAQELSKQSIAADPGNGMYLDTLAEIQFRLGNAQEAVNLENSALLYRPDDEFMHRQIERFRAGVAKKP